MIFPLFPKKKSAARLEIIVIPAAVILAYWLYFVFGVSNLLVGGFLAALIFLAAFFNTNFALSLLIFSMLLSPEFSTGETSARAVTVRLDDMLLVVACLGWLAKMAVDKGLGFLRVTPLNKPIAAYVAVAVISTGLGVLWGSVTFVVGFFYVVKYLEYFFLFFMVSNNLKEIAEVKRFVYMMILVMVIVCALAWAQHLGGAMRVSAPFEGEYGEPNTLGGYLLVMLMVSVGLLLNLGKAAQRLFLAAAVFMGFPVMLFTLSRGSWLGFVFASPALLFFTKKNKLPLVAIFLVTIWSFSVIFPKYVYERINYTFQQNITQRVVMGRKLGLDRSAAARIDTWRKGLQQWAKSPIFGYGVGSRGQTVDNQYARLLLEAGLLGFLAFFWIIFWIFKQALANFRLLREDDFCAGLVAGYLAATVGLLIHGFSAGTFIIIRIMEPFWFLTAIVMVLPELKGALPPPPDIKTIGAA